jgi:hypothetical protein
MPYQHGRDSRPPIEPGHGYPKPGTCGDCGKDITRVCPTHKFCGECGAKRKAKTEKKSREKGSKV